MVLSMLMEIDMRLLDISNDGLHPDISDETLLKIYTEYVYHEKSVWKFLANTVCSLVVQVTKWNETTAETDMELFLKDIYLLFKTKSLNECEVVLDILPRYLHPRIGAKEKYSTSQELCIQLGKKIWYW